MSTAENAPRAKWSWKRVALFALAAALVLFAIAKFGSRVSAELPRFIAWVDSLGAWGPAAFILGYAVLVVLAVPGSVLTIAAGSVFGVAEGTAYVFVAATLGANLCFLIGRYLARDWVARRIAGDARFSAIDRAVGHAGRKIVFLLRLAPAFPFNLLNYGFPLTRVRFVDHFIGSLGMLPATLLYVYLGSVGGDLLSGGLSVAKLALFGVTAVLVVLAVRAARRALDEASGPDLSARQ
ncbi:MAG TPA: TVP38/TMEM64 family protein [Myxococcota bacterium]|nr:TVP38/TMEM64 family protein [Myxococcota bacterium]